MFLDSNVTFFWTATTDPHNINYIGNSLDDPVDGKTAKDFYDQFIESMKSSYKPERIQSETSFLLNLQQNISDYDK